MFSTSVQFLFFCFISIFIICNSQVFSSSPPPLLGEGREFVGFSKLSQNSESSSQINLNPPIQGQGRASDDEQDENESWEEEDADADGDGDGEQADADEEQESDDNEEFRREDLIDDVTELERDAQVEEQSSLLPHILGLFSNKKQAQHTSWDDFHDFGNQDKINDTSLPEDLSDISEDIVDDITAGVEESLLLSDDTKFRTANETGTRQFSIYMFQGQYMPEARLNRFVDGAIRNMGGELRVAVMDPLYFRVLPRGRVESRRKPIGKGRFDVEGEESRDGRAGFFDRVGQKVTAIKKVKVKPVKKVGNKKQGNLAGTRRRFKNNQRRKKPGKTGLNRQRPNNKKNQNRRRKFFRRKKKPLANRRRPGNKKNNKKKNQAKRQKAKKRRQKRRAKRNVGGGRVEGLSVLSRDGDAEMQVFGNYTLIRSHMKMGPVELSMQFKTRRGLRRTGATLPAIRMHTVTRVNMEGSEMIDFLLDRPHPESIKVRGKLFPLAQRIARNIFARLFVPNSFLVSKLREKASLALLSKPKSRK